MHKAIRTIVVMGLMCGAGSVLAEDTPAQNDSVEYHQTLAKQYEEKAAALKKEAAEHRQMKADYQKKVATPNKSGAPVGWVTKMEKHCDRFAADADKLASDSEMMAQFHRMRAQELQAH